MFNQLCMKLPLSITLITSIVKGKKFDDTVHCIHRYPPLYHKIIHCTLNKAHIFPENLDICFVADIYLIICGLTQDVQLCGGLSSPPSLQSP